MTAVCGQIPTSFSLFVDFVDDEAIHGHQDDDAGHPRDSEDVLVAVGETRLPEGVINGAVVNFVIKSANKGRE